ncbi:MAG TPA: alpha/beta hydrolase-fold protein [Caulobacteraceae bacterium]|nr:alpha/beta hydrolase-fold protein [Caulobacteraceae bacterium]
MRFAALALVALLIAGGASIAHAAPTPPEAGQPIVIGQSYVISSRVLGGPRRINVYLPADYNQPGRRFPVLFLLDGGVGEDFVHIAGLAQILGAYGDAQQMIVVGIEGVDRRHDLTEPSAYPEDAKLAPTGGGAAAYRRFLVDEVKPWVAAHYAISGRSALIGESFGGLFVLDTLLREPAAFDDFIAISPSLWWDGGNLSRDAGPALRGLAGAGKRLWLAFEPSPQSPTHDSAAEAEANARLVAALSKAEVTGFSWTIRSMPGETHATILHPAAREALRALYPGQRGPGG